MIRVLWLCNTVPPDCCELFGFKKRYHEGWISGMMYQLKRYNDLLLGICLPIRDAERMKDGITKDYLYYSFQMMNMEDNSDHIIERFCVIIKDFQPDVIHIWGSEYGQSLAMVRACKKMGIISRSIVHIQGLISAMPPYYAVRIPNEWLIYRGENQDSIQDETNKFYKRGENEKAILLEAGYALGRTEWDKSYISSLSRIKYRYCGEILRSDFYQEEYCWKYENCTPHSIFITQGGYPLKGIHLMIPAISILKKKYPDITVWISGNSTLAQDRLGIMNPYCEYILSLLREYDLEDVFHFTGPLNANDMIKRYLKTNVLAVTSALENSSNSIGEAQILGVPVIATYTGGTPSLIEHGETGLMYQMDAPYMLASYVEKVFEDVKYASYLSENEKKAAKKRYDPDKVGRCLYDIYLEVKENSGISC